MSSERKYLFPAVVHRHIVIVDEGHAIDLAADGELEGLDPLGKPDIALGAAEGIGAGVIPEIGGDVDAHEPLNQMRHVQGQAHQVAVGAHRLGVEDIARPHARGELGLELLD